MLEEQMSRHVGVCSYKVDMHHTHEMRPAETSIKRRTEMSKNIILMSILATALLAACSDNDDKAAITDGTLGCSVDASGVEFVAVWKDGAWQKKEECTGSCSDGACLSTQWTCSGDASECVKDATDGDNASLLRTCANGEYRYTNCSLLGDKICGTDSVGNAACIDKPNMGANACIDGLYRCNLDGVREYCSNGAWATNACPSDKVCSAGACIEPPHVCNDNQRVCDGNVARTCQNNAWTDEICDEATQACVAGECVALPKEGDSCILSNGGVLTSTCSNGTLYECGLGYTDQSSGEIGYLVFTQACDDAKNGTVCLNLSSGAVCAYKNDSPLMKEVGACTAEGEVSFVECYKDEYGYVDLYATKCVQADGVLYAEVITPASICEGNTRISCDSQTGAVIEESCIDCYYSGAYEEAQCMRDTASDGNNAGSNNGGGNSGGGDGAVSCPASGYKVCDSTCNLQSGGTCIDYCQAQGSNICCMDDTSVYCSDPSQTSYMSCDEVDVEFAEDGGCVVDEEGTKCQDVCREEENSDVCYVDLATGYILCSEPDA